MRLARLTSFLREKGTAADLRCSPLVRSDRSMPHHGRADPEKPVVSVKNLTIGWRDVIVQQSLAMVEQHLGRFGPYGPNEAMVGRLRDVMSAGTRVTGADANFYLHELNEATLMGRGMSYEAAYGAEQDPS
jgi:hypothetical protein